MNSQNFPFDWVLTTLGQIRRNDRKTIDPTRTPEQVFELYSVTFFNTGYPEVVLGKDIGSNKQIVEKDTVLVCKINPRINRVWVVGELSEHPKIASTEWVPFKKMEDIYPLFLCYYMQTNDFRDYLAQNVSGVGGSLMRARTSALDEYPFAYPPLTEQERIVERIESLFTQLDSGVAGLKRAQVALKRYKASVLKVACEGRLVMQEINDEPAGEMLMRLGKSPHTGNDLPRLPDNWCWTNVSTMANVGTGATPLRSKTKYWQNGNIPWITSGAMNELEVDHAEEYITEAALKETNVKIFPTGTLLVAMYGEGKTRGKVSELLIDATTNQACAALVFDEMNLAFKKYVKLFFLKNYEDIRRLSSGGVQPNLNLSIIKNMLIPLPPLLEQRRIIAEVERRISVVKELEQTIEANLKRAGRLRQAILKLAFQGRL